MSLGSGFRRTINVMVDSKLSSAEQKQRVATVARDGLAELVRSGAASPVFSKFVDGTRDAPEESVKLNGGTIAYLFSNLAQAAAFGLSYAVNRSPESSGRFKSSWFVVVDGVPWTRPLVEIPNNVQVIITNREPYARKIESGGMKMTVPPGIVEDTRQQLQRKYPTLKVDRTFVNLPSGNDARGGAVPYILRGRGHESGISYEKKVGYIQKHPKRPARAKDRQKGSVLTYPAVVISERIR